MNKDAASEVMSKLFADGPIILVTFGSTRVADGGFIPWLMEGTTPEVTSSLRGLGLDVVQQIHLAFGLHPMMLMSTDLASEVRRSAEEYKRFIETTHREQTYAYEICFGSPQMFAAMLMALDRKVMHGRDSLRMLHENGSRYYVTSVEPGERMCLATIGRNPLARLGAVA